MKRKKYKGPVLRSGVFSRMDIQSLTLLGNSSIGIFSLATDKYSIFPYSVDTKTVDLIKEILEVPVIQTTLNNSNLNGLFAVGNSNDLLLPNLVNEIEYNQISENIPDSVEISVLDSTITALGNVIVSSDDRAVLSPEFSKAEQTYIADVLDVEVATRNILNSSIIGSMIFMNANGLLAHPLTSDDDLDWLESFFKVSVDVVTVNRGTPYPRPGIVGNRHGIMVGSDTTGPELMRIFEVLSR